MMQRYILFLNKQAMNAKKIPKISISLNKSKIAFEALPHCCFLLLTSDFRPLTSDLSHLLSDIF